MGWPRAGSALVCACLALASCGTFSAERRVDVGRLQSAVEARLGMHLQRVTPPAGQPGIAVLRATFSGGGERERVTVLEFFEPAGVAEALGTASRSETTIVLRRHNVAILYTRTTGPDHRADLERALHAAPLVTGLPTA